MNGTADALEAADAARGRVAEATVNRYRAVVGSALFFVLAPGGVAGLVPWWITRWRRPATAGGLTLLLGGVLTVIAGAVLLHAFWRFVHEGAGTPAPVAPTAHLVVGGAYRFVRNPMYLAVGSAIAGQAIALESPALAVYGAFVLAAMVAFVRLYEEPVLARRHGAEYEAYRRAVPGWWPRLSPWNPTRHRDVR